MRGEDVQRENRTKIIVLRHGQSTWNAERRWQGRADPPLTPLGEAQAVAAARSVGVIDKVVTSSLQRARRTGEIISGYVGCGSVEELDDLQERSVGAWQGFTGAMIQAEFPGWLARRQKPDGWESDEAVKFRARRALLGIAHRHPGAIVLVVSHGGVLSILDSMLGSQVNRYANLHGRMFFVSEGKLSAGERISPIDSDYSSKNAVL